MRTTRFAVALTLALTAMVPILTAATPFGSNRPPISASVSSTATTNADEFALLRGSSPFAWSHGGLATIAKAKLFTFTAVLNGSYNVPVHQNGYIYATMSGGTAPYTFTWWRDGQVYGTIGGSNSSISPNFCCTGTEYFMVDVKDANGLTAQSPQFFVHVN